MLVSGPPTQVPVESHEYPDGQLVHVGFGAHALVRHASLAVQAVVTQTRHPEGPTSQVCSALCETQEEAPTVQASVQPVVEPVEEVEAVDVEPLLPVVGIPEVLLVLPSVPDEPVAVLVVVELDEVLEPVWPPDDVPPLAPGAPRQSPSTGEQVRPGQHWLFAVQAWRLETQAPPVVVFEVEGDAHAAKKSAPSRIGRDFIREAPADGFGGASLSGGARDVSTT